MQNSLWSKLIPWFLTISCSTVLVIIGFFLISNIQWFKSNVFSSDIIDVNRPEYRIYAYQLYLSMIKRSVGLFSGFATIFLGLGVSFFTLKEKTILQTDAVGLATKIATASPGLIAVIVGSYIMIITINSKDEFPPYGNGINQNARLDSSISPSLPNNQKGSPGASGKSQLLKNDTLDVSVLPKVPNE